MTEPTTLPAAVPHPGVAIQHAVHAALRRDLDRLVTALATTRAPDQAVRDYASEYLFQLHHHHTFEDDAVWPLMRERLGPSSTALLDRNLAEHGDVVVSVGAFETSLGPSEIDRAEAHGRAERMRSVIDTHLRHEEADVIPLIPEAFTLDDVSRFQEQSAEGNPPDRFLPWLLESAPAPVASGFDAVLPPPVKDLLATVWMPAWHATVDGLTATPRGAQI